MTVRKTLAPISGLAIERRVTELILGLTVVAIPAVLAGMISHVAGAVVASIGVLVLMVLAYRRVAGDVLARIDWGLVGILVVVASPLVPARLGASVAGVGADDIPLLAGVALAAFNVTRTEGLAGLVSKFAWPLYAFALWNGFITLIEPGFTVADLARGLGRWLLVALAFSLVVTVARRKGRGLVMLGGLVVIGTFEALFGLWAYAVNWTVESDVRAVLIGLERWREYQLLFGESPGRISGTLGVSSNFFGGLMLIPALVAAGWFQRAEGRVARFAFGVASVAMIYSLSLTFTRASVVAVGMGALFATLLIKRLGFAALVTGALVLVFATTPLSQRFGEANDRAALASQGFDAVLEEPATGLGSGSFVDSLFDEEEPVLIATPHNSFLLAAAETGIPGGVIFLAASVWPAVVLLRRTGVRGRRSALMAAICGGLLAFGAQALSNNIFHIPAVAVSYWVALGAGLGLTPEAEGDVTQFG